MTKPEKIERESLHNERVAALRELFPEAFSDGEVNLETLKELLSSSVSDDDSEHYGLNWPGKKKARRLAKQAPKATLRAVPNAGVDEETTRNMVLVGDNLQILLALQKSYANSVKLIYIDPPYNTGNDFIYKDSFAIDEDLYLQETRQSDLNGRLVSNPQSGGRFHSNWLNFMYPRLAIAQRLMREDGFIVVSIDDAEVGNLRLLMNTVFGEENFIAALVWDRNRKNDAKYFSVGHEYMLVYARNIGKLQDDGVVLRAPKEGVEEVRALFQKLREEHNDDWEKVRVGLKEFYASIPDDDPRKPLKRYTLVDQDGPYEKGDLNWPGPGGPKYEVLHPLTKKPVKVPSSGWRLSTKARFDEEVAAGRIVFGGDETKTPRAKRCLFDLTSQVLGSVHYSYAQTAAQRFEALFDKQRVFDNPKPFDDLSTITHYLTGPDDIILDFFAGSGSTGHGVWLANQKHQTTRTFVLVQVDVAVDPKVESGKNALKLGLDTIDKITCERLRRVSKAMKAEGAQGDLGFRVYREASPAFAHSSHLSDEAMKTGTTFSLQFQQKTEHAHPSELFAEVLLLLGYSLDSKQEQIPQGSSNTLWRFVDPRIDQPLILCLDASVDEDLVHVLQECTKCIFVCRDDALNDSTKIRFYDALKQVGSNFKVL